MVFGLSDSVRGRGGEDTSGRLQREQISERRDCIYHDGEQIAPQPAGGDATGGLSALSSGRLLRGEGRRLCPPGKQRSGQQPGPHRWHRDVRRASDFPKVTRKVRKTLWDTHLTRCCGLKRLHLRRAMCFARQQSEDEQLVGVQQHQEEPAVQEDLFGGLCLPGRLHRNWLWSRRWV